MRQQLEVNPAGQVAVPGLGWHRTGWLRHLVRLRRLLLLGASPARLPVVEALYEIR